MLYRDVATVVGGGQLQPALTIATTTKEKHIKYYK